MHPIKQRSRWPEVTIGLACIFSTGYLTAVLGLADNITAKVAAARDRGYAEGLASQTWKSTLLTDTKYTDKACTAWWFQMNHGDRTIKLEGKPKRL